MFFSKSTMTVRRHSEKPIIIIYSYPLEMCDPAHLFLVLSLIIFFVLSYYDYYNMNSSCMASYNCSNPSKPIYYYLLILGLILLWTWVLNFQCEMGYSLIVWAEIILPIALIYLGYQINWNPYASPY
jgi:hypothetical protein